MTNERQQPDSAPRLLAVLRVRKPAAWVLRGDPRTVERARRSGLSIHAGEE